MWNKKLLWLFYYKIKFVAFVKRWLDWKRKFFACNFSCAIVVVGVFVTSTGSFPQKVPFRRLDWVNEWKVLDHTLTILNAYLAARCRYNVQFSSRDLVPLLSFSLSHFFPSFRLHEGWVNLKTGIYAVRFNCLLHIHIHTLIYVHSAKVPLAHRHTAAV